eukprot:15485650-Alexandrium_andersonii.AAC.1
MTLRRNSILFFSRGCKQATQVPPMASRLSSARARAQASAKKAGRWRRPFQSPCRLRSRQTKRQGPKLHGR